MFDFRHVPLVLGVLYGGTFIGGFLLLFLLAYRYYIGSGEGFYMTLISSSVIYLSMVYMKARFDLKTPYKITIAVFFCTIVLPIPLTILLFWLKIITFKLALYKIVFRIIEGLAICLTVYFIEFILFHYKMRLNIQQSEKMRLVSEIAASVSHEVRNPLTTVKGMLQLIGEADLPNEKKQEFIKLALSELDSAVNIISDYLTFAKPHLESMQPINLVDECKHVYNVLIPYANMHQVELTFRFEPSCMILGDSQKLRQSLINLVKNCIEASENRTVELSLFLEKENAVINVKDTGIGMTKDQIERLGTPYYSTKEKGTGLGAMVSFSLIKAMNGSINVESKVDIGTLFIITFPLYSE